VECKIGPAFVKSFSVALLYFVSEIVLWFAAALSLPSLAMMILWGVEVGRSAFSGYAWLSAVIFAPIILILPIISRREATHWLRISEHELVLFSREVVETILDAIPLSHVKILRVYATGAGKLVIRKSINGKREKVGRVHFSGKSPIEIKTLIDDLSSKGVAIDTVSSGIMIYRVVIGFVGFTVLMLFPFLVAGLFQYLLMDSSSAGFVSVTNMVLSMKYLLVYFFVIGALLYLRIVSYWLGLSPWWIHAHFSKMRSWPWN